MPLALELPREELKESLLQATRVGLGVVIGRAFTDRILARQSAMARGAVETMLGVLLTIYGVRLFKGLGDFGIGVAADGLGRIIVEIIP